MTSVRLTKDDIRIALLAIGGFSLDTQTTCDEALLAIIKQCEIHGARSPIHGIARMLAQFVDNAPDNSTNQSGEKT